MKVKFIKLSVFAVLLTLLAALGVAAAPPREAQSSVSQASELPLDAQFAISRALGKETGSYHAAAVAGGYRLDNRGHALSASFLPTGVQIQTGSARWGLALSGYGYGTALRAVGAVAPQAQANRVEYGRGALTEWYVNGPLGVQQGFTLASAPGAGAGKPLTLALTLSGGLEAVVDHGGDGLTLRRADGETVLRYRGLSAYDAAGRRLRAWLEIAPLALPRKGDRTEVIVLVRVDDAGAQYPLVVDPFIQQAKLTASDGVADTAFGYSVAISGDGDTVVVGAYFANGAQGSAYVFVKTGTAWPTNETAKLTASDGASPDHFGFSVAISGDGATVVVGAYGANSYQGSAYVFVQEDNEAPTDIALSNSSVAENAGANAAVGNLSTTDPDAGDTFTYTLVSGSGDTGNGSFNISGASLRATASLDFETQSSYSVRVRSTDAGGLWTEKAFTITVTNVNEAFAGTPGDADCHGKSVSALTKKFGGLNKAALVLGFPSVQALQDAIRAFCHE